MKITADARRRHSDKTHILYEGECHSLFRNDGVLLYAVTDVIRTSLDGKYTIQIALSLAELDAARTAELVSLRARIARLEKRVETL